MKLALEFAGGSQTLVKNQSRHEIELEDGKEWLMSDLLDWILQNLLVDCSTPDLLIKDGNVRPGILVLVNDTDWELLGNVDTVISEGDTVTFLSTLHGG
uniref:Ubiquitin-related modifier 1 homolog n=1 Tax=Steinernema glaseri TaxID=37863 RepID=A0A1I8AWT7_9BILA